MAREPSIVAPFRRDISTRGYSILKSLLPAPDVETLRTAAEELVSFHRDPARPLFLFDNAVQRDDRLRPLMSSPRVLNVLMDIFGVHFLLTASELWIRPRGAAGEDWHRDGGPQMSHTTHPHIVKVQFFLTDVTASAAVASANLVIARGSHRWRQTPTADRLDQAADVITAKAGDAIVWTGSAWHKVLPNAAQDRVSVILGFSPRWMRPYDYDAVDEGFDLRATELERLLMARPSLERGSHYYPGDTRLREAVFARAR